MHPSNEEKGELIPCKKAQSLHTSTGLAQSRQIQLLNLRCGMNMDTGEDAEAKQILRLQAQIAERLDRLGFVGDADTRGNIIHHLAESVVIGNKLVQTFLPTFLSLPLEQRKQLGEIVVDMQCELTELKEALSDMEPALLTLMNFLTRK